MVACDQCAQAYHTYCAEPALTRVPVGAWRCSACHKHASVDAITALGTCGSLTSQRSDSNASVPASVPLGARGSLTSQRSDSNASMVEPNFTQPQPRRNKKKRKKRLALSDSDDEEEDESGVCSV
jgi:hypothetical protein